MSQAASELLASGASERKKSQCKKEVDIQQMKKLILKQITDVTQEDLNVMSKNEIISFYNELISANQDGVEPIEQIQTMKAQAQERKQDIQGGEKSDKQNSTNCKQQSAIKIGQGSYVVPKYISQLSYKINNKRFEILCGSPVESVAEKRQAIIAAYNPAVAGTIKALKNQQVLETYSRLRVPQKKQSFYLKPTAWPEEQKIFCIYVEKLPKDQKFIELERIISAQLLEKQQMKTMKKKQPADSTFENKIQKQRMQMHRYEVNDDFGFDDGFFNEFNNEKQSKNLIKPKNIEKIEKNEVKASAKSDLRQKIQQSKKKMQVQSSSQTQKKQSTKKTKTKLTIISQVEYIEQNTTPNQRNDTENHLGFDEQQLRPEVRVRPLDTFLALEQQNTAQKLKFFQIEKVIFEKGSIPNKIVLDWINEMKILVDKLEKQYIQQYECKWTVIQE